MFMEIYDEKGNPMVQVPKPVFDALEPLFEAARSGSDFSFHFSEEACKAINELAKAKSKVEMK